MKFSYKYYSDLLQNLLLREYVLSSYNNEVSNNKSVILRHDVDCCLEKALEMAKLEFQLGVQSTYFVLLSTDFYNVFSKKSNQLLQEILLLGHEIGLHFDELRYSINDKKDLELYVEYERKILEGALGKSVKTVSMHRPSAWILENDIQFSNCINSYNTKFFKDYKYVSDSRMNWREDVTAIIESGVYDRLHILTHPFWYHESDKDMYEILNDFVEKAKSDRKISLCENIKDLVL